MKQFTFLKTMLLAAIFMLVGSVNVCGQSVTIFSENMGTNATGNPTVSNYEGFQNNMTHKFTGTADVRVSTASNQTGMSGGNNVYFTNNVDRYCAISEINTLNCTDLELSFAFHKTGNATATINSTQFVVEVATDYDPVANTGTFSSLSFSTVSTGAIWSLITISDGIPASSTLTIRFRQNQTSQQFRIDDVKLMGIPPVPTVTAIPAITAIGDEKAEKTYWDNAMVTLDCSTEGASIYYTTNGEEPTISSTLYDSPFAVTSTTTIKAIAVKSGLEDSSVAEQTITIAPPAISALPHAESFSGSLNDWYSYSVAGDQKWGTATATGTYTTFAQMNGYAGSNNENEDWLISPSVSCADGLLFSFASQAQYVGDALQLKYSTDYSGYGDPIVATWTDITELATWSATNSNVWAESGDVIVDETVSVRFAFVYTSTTLDGTHWKISNVAISEKPTSPAISVVEANLPTMRASVGKSAATQITVSGLNLTENISLAIEGANSALFEVSPANVAHTDGVVSNTSVTITYTPTAADGPHTATLKINSAGATEITFELSGTVITIPNVIITEVYGGGGNSGATYTHDFVELYNTTDSDVNISGWSLQYYSATGTAAPSGTNLYSFGENSTIEPNKHFLVQLAAAGEVGAALPTPDATGTINLSGSNGKIILFTTSSGQAISDIANVIGNQYFKDYVPYGTAVPIWGSSLAALNATTSASRKMESGVYVYTQNVGVDFEVVAPNPQNSGLPGGGTGLKTIENSKLYATDGKIHFAATAGKTIEIYNAMGQRLYQGTTTSGLNSIAVDKGIVLVKIGNSINKLIVK